MMECQKTPSQHGLLVRASISNEKLNPETTQKEDFGLPFFIGYRPAYPEFGQFGLERMKLWGGSLR